MYRRRSNFIQPRAGIVTVALISLLSLGACSSGNDDNGGTAEQGDSSTPDDSASSEASDNPTVAAAEQLLAFIAGSSTGNDAGQIERLSIGDGDIGTGTYPATLSDIRVDTDGRNVYQIGRFMIDSITRFDPADTSVIDYQYSVNGDEAAANPYDIAFVNQNKAYIVRYGSDKVWIVNPAATTEADFKIGELDLSAYDADVPNASSAVVVGEKLYVLMERLTGFDPVNTGYVAVFDTTTDAEVETGQGADGLPGIALSTTNPGGLQYLDSTGELYVTGRGNIFNEFNDIPGDPYQGGIETIDPESFEHAMLLDDGSADDNQGFFSDALVVSASRGYVLTYSAFESVTLRSFNPATGLLDDEPVAELVDQNLSALAIGPNGRLWVGVRGDTPGFVLIDPADNSVLKPLVATQLNPLNIVFLSVPQ